MSTQPSPDKVRELLYQFKERIESLREQNAALREELSQLRRENDQLRAAYSTLAPSEAEEQSLDELFVSELDSFGQALDTQEREVQWRPPQAVNRRTMPAQHDLDLYRPSAAPSTALSSTTLGAGLGPEISARIGVLPAQPVARPSVDLGYINRVSADELNHLPYGLIVVDTQGHVLFYNETESKLTGFARERIIGKNFFQDVAPCARVKEFEGRFLDFVDGKLGRVTFFDFAFHFERGTQNVVIGLSHGRKSGHINIMLVRQG